VASFFAINACVDAIGSAESNFSRTCESICIYHQQKSFTFSALMLLVGWQ